MKKKILLFLMLIGFVFLPLVASAAEKKYNTLDLKGALAEEEIEEAFKNYKPNDDAITIYLFRGKGCGYCRAFLTFLNSITDEYGKYFNLVSYEVWNDADNSSLMQEVSEYLGEPAGGVPYIVIGDKVFAGYANVYDDGIKEAITTLYKTKKSKRYDVFNEMKKNPKKDSSTTQSDSSIIIWNLVFVFVATVIIMSYVGIKFKELNNKIDSLNPVKTEINKIKENIKTKEETKKIKKDTKKGK